MSESGQRRSAFFELRGVLGFVLLALLANHRHLVSEKLWLLGIAFLLSNLALLFVPQSGFKGVAISYGVFFLDMTVLTVFFSSIAGIESESLLIYYLTVFMATLGADLRKSVAIAAVAGALYLGTVMSHNGQALLNPETLLHIPLFFITAVTTGFLAQEIGAHKRRIRGLKSIQNGLVSDIQASGENLSLSESARATAQNLARRFQDLVEGLHAIIWEADAATMLFEFVSPRAQEILGYPTDQWVAVSNFWIEHIHPEDRAAAMTALSDGLKEGDNHEFEYRMAARDGRLIWFRNVVRVVRDDAGRATRIRGVMIDITRQKQAEEEDLLFMLSLDMMCIVTFDGHFKRMNPAWERTLGFSQAELRAFHFVDLIHPGDRESSLAEVKKLSSGEVITSFENRFRCKDGSYKWFLWSAAPVAERRLFYGVGRDITERKRAENEIRKLNDELEQRVAERTAQLEDANAVLQTEIAERKQAVEARGESESRYRLLFEANPQPMWVYDLGSLDFIAVNDAAVRLYQYSRQEFLSMSMVDIRPPEDVPAMLEAIRRSTGGIDRSGVARHRKKDGSLIDVEMTSHTLTFAGKRARLVLANDVTERKRALAALRESEERYRVVAETATDAIITIDEKGEILFVNSAAQRIFGYLVSEMVGQSLTVLMPEAMRPTYLAGLTNYLQTGVRTTQWNAVELPGLHRDGMEIPLEVSFGEFIKDDKRSFTGIVRDVTDRKKLEDQLRQAQKMEAIGQLAGGVAHDFNNLLTIISGYSQLLIEQSGVGELERGHAKEILKAANRAASLTRQLLAFSRRQVLAPQVLDLNAVVGNVDKMLRRLIGEDIELATCLHPNLGNVKADPGQIEQVILNLAVNARDAMPRGGKLTLETANAELDETYTRNHFPAQPGSYVMLAVSDTGIGMDEATQAHMFEPFFTTKEQGKGTGLGLATVYGIVKQSNGYIWVYSEPGRGTAVKIYLPLVQEEVMELETRETSTAARHASETVLVVEDEEAVRSLVRNILSSTGYKVIEASRGDEALSLCGRHQGPIHLMLTDVIMPQMSGRELANRLGSFHPSMKVLFMSGYTTEGIVHHGVLEKDTAFLQKPFTPNSLIHKVREVLDSSSNAKSAAV